MTERLIDLSDAPARLSVKHAQLVMEHGEEKQTLPLEDVAVLMVSNPGVTYTQAVLSGLMERSGVFIACDGKHLPAGMMLPLEGHHLQTERLKAQVEAGLPTRKRAWQEIVQAKVRAQGRLLDELHGDARGLLEMAKRVKSGDTDNVEGQAARKYWRALFGDPTFQRDRDLPGANAMLNYGYTVLRGIVARAVVAAGLHPSIGVHHHNRYDAYCLADDLMEPFRPRVDKAVVLYLREEEEPEELTPAVKRHLVAALLERHTVDGEERTLFDGAARSAVSMVRVFQGQRKTLVLPEEKWGQ